MSGTVGIGLLGTAAGVLSSILLTPSRGFGTASPGFSGLNSLIIPDVTISESHKDTLQITKHPVQQGATISDHAFKIPPTVTIRAGWSSSSLNAILNVSSISDVASLLSDGALNSVFGDSYAQQIYNQLLTLQNSLVPFNLYTGKRPYQNMMLTDLGVETDKHSEYSLMISATFEYMNIVSVTTEALPAATQKFPDATSSTTDTGNQAPIASTHTESFLSQLAGKLGF